MAPDFVNVRHDNSDGHALSFYETIRNGTSSSSSVLGDGDTVVISITGRSPQNEDDTNHIQNVFKNFLEQSCHQVKFEVADPSEHNHVDFVLESNGTLIKVQVVRSITDPNFWKDLAAEGKNEKEFTKCEVFELISNAIDLKVNKISDPAIRSEIVLVLDANRNQIFTSEILMNQYVDENKEFLSSTGFKEIWIVGYNEASVRRIF